MGATALGASVVVLLALMLGGCLRAGPPKTPNQRAVERAAPASTPVAPPAPPEPAPVRER